MTNYHPDPNFHICLRNVCSCNKKCFWYILLRYLLPHYKYCVASSKNIIISACFFSVDLRAYPILCKLCYWLVEKVNPSVVSRVKLLQTQLNKLTSQQLKEALAVQQQALPSIDDAFHLPIPAELISRQQGGLISGPSSQPYTNSGTTTPPGTNQPSPKKRKMMNKKKVF